MKKISLLILLAMSSQIMAAPAKGTKVPEYKIEVTQEGYVPAILKVKANEAFKLKITRLTNATCAREIVVPNKKLKVDLPLNKEVVVDMPALEKGEVKFGCAMDLMISGVIHAD